MNHKEVMRVKLFSKKNTENIQGFNLIEVIIIVLITSFLIKRLGSSLDNCRLNVDTSKLVFSAKSCCVL